MTGPQTKNSSSWLENDPHFLKWKRQYDAYKTNSQCGLCLYFHTPGCAFSGLSDVIKATDCSCTSFYSLAERLEILYRSRRSAKKFLKEVEQL